MAPQMVHMPPAISSRYDASDLTQHEGRTFYVGHQEVPTLYRINDGQVFINQHSGIRLTRIAAIGMHTLGHGLIEAARDYGVETLARQIDLYGAKPEKGLCLVLSIDPEDPIISKIGLGIITPPILDIRGK